MSLRSWVEFRDSKVGPATYLSVAFKSSKQQVPLASYLISLPVKWLSDLPQLVVAED